jgi:hypothetical protein
VHHDRSDPDWELSQLLHERRLLRPLVLDGRMDADVAEWQAWRATQLGDEPRQLAPRQRRQLDCEGRHLARFVDERGPVAPRSLKDARGDPDRMVVGQGMSRCISGGGHGPTVSRADDDQTAQETKTGTKRVPNKQI